MILRAIFPFLSIATTTSASGLLWQQQSNPQRRNLSSALKSFNWCWACIMNAYYLNGKSLPWLCSYPLHLASLFSSVQFSQLFFPDFSIINAFTYSILWHVCAAIECMVRFGSNGRVCIVYVFYVARVRILFIYRSVFCSSSFSIDIGINGSTGNKQHQHSTSNQER